ncbi:MAG: GNAT family N-acetyltransferase [Stappiaceae bacterium]
MFRSASSEQDIDDIVSLGREIWTQHYVPIIGAEQVDYMLRTFHSKDVILRQIGHENYLYFIIADHGQAVGYIGVQPQGETLFLSKLYILSAERGKGIGRLAMNYVCDVGRQLGLSLIHLTVNRENRATIAAYEKIGFVKTGEIKADIGSGYVMDDYKMELALEKPEH